MKKLFWLITFISVFIWSAISPYDTLTWLLEVAPAIIGFIIIIFSYKQFPLTPLVYNLILIHCIILMIGGHYTYAEVPLFNDLKDFLLQIETITIKLGILPKGLFLP